MNKFTVTPDVAASNLSTWNLERDGEMLRSAFHDVVRDLNVNQFRSALRFYSIPHAEAFDRFLQETTIGRGNCKANVLY